jgi:hypothetical protein
MNRTHQLVLAAVLAFFCYQVFAGDVPMPSFAQGSADLTATTNTKGKALTDLGGLIAVIVCALGVITGVIKMNGGSAEDGKERIKNSFIGLVLLGSLWAIIRFALA